MISILRYIRAQRKYVATELIIIVTGRSMKAALAMYILMVMETATVKQIARCKFLAEQAFRVTWALAVIAMMEILQCIPMQKKYVVMELTTTATGR